MKVLLILAVLVVVASAQSPSRNWDSMQQWPSRYWDSMQQWPSRYWDSMQQYPSRYWDNMQQYPSRYWDSMQQWPYRFWDSMQQRPSRYWDSMQQYPSLWGRNWYWQSSWVSTYIKFILCWFQTFLQTQLFSIELLNSLCERLRERRPWELLEPGWAWPRLIESICFGSNICLKQFSLNLLLSTTIQFCNNLLPELSSV